MIDNGTIVSGRYRVDELIGSGGTANVYKAYDSIECRTVALKVLKDEHRDDAEFVRRFEREAKAVFMLNHENIARSYDVGEDGGVSYIVLEYVEGETLKEMIERVGALQPKVAVNIASQVLDALSHAHECGIIHRDVKPQNVIITPRGRAKLTDFGIARDTASTTRTFAGANVLGSVHYISPEQARGENVTVSTDIYSTGIMLYEMLTGEVPFGGDNSVAIALKHLREEIIPPNEINPRVSRALSDVVVKAASKNPRARYSTARQMKTDLQRALREPNGKFARLNASSDSSPHKHAGILNITVMTIIVLGLFVAMFFIALTLKKDSEADSSEYIIPTLAGKSLTEATELAELRGFKIEVSGYESSDEYAEDCIIEQSPLAGAKAKQGDSISVTVSVGGDYISVPDIYGKTIQDALVTLADMDLALGTPQYVTSDLPAGQIIKQEPVAGTETFAGDTIDVWVSGTPGESEEMPSVVDRDYNEAIATLRVDGFSSFILHPTSPTNICAEDKVLRQSPSAGTNTTLGTAVELWICRVELGEYSADIAFNLDTTEAENAVVVTAVIAEGVELSIYETTLPAGVLPISFTGCLKEQGEYTVNVYVNGINVRTSTVKFS